MGICWSMLMSVSQKPQEELFTNLPREMTKEILQRLPIRSIIMCKCVCKLWRYMIEEGELMPPYSQKPCLAFSFPLHLQEIYTVCDEALKPLLRFRLPTPHEIHDSRTCIARVIIGSIDGLLLVWHSCDNHLFIVNPMTREYVTLLLPMRLRKYKSIFGIGVSKLSGQYKILCGTRESTSYYVHTLGGKGEGEGGGLWKCIEGASAPTALVVPGTPIQPIATFINGNLHWLSYDLEGNRFVSCFDLDSELFTRFSLPCPNTMLHLLRLRVLDHQLCLCDISDGLHVVIWKMNNYGDTNSWTKEYTFAGSRIYGLVIPLNVLANGNLLFVSGEDNQLFIYSKSTETIVAYGLLQEYGVFSSNIAFYTPSFVSLTSMGIRNVVINDTLSIQ
ncbi:putative F-box protein At1g32420 [Salvia splendens]|uniref:putative F-box protein At1g32420 n=1 Tax=Salvia splendens TaxID=180675 RepID=UPI001C271609|nr:putative F-box protein At1g32420 [Salvia splendens]